MLLTTLCLGSDLCLGAVDYAVWRLTCVSLLLTMLFWDLTCVSVLCLGSDLCLGAVDYAVLGSDLCLGAVSGI